MHTMLSLYGLDATCLLVKQVMAMLAVQNQRRLFREMNISETGFAAALSFLRRLLSSRGDDFAVELPKQDVAVITLRSHRPFGDDLPEALREALFTFPSMCVRLLGGTILMTRCRETATGAPDHEVWEIRDTHRWLY
ncbi:MAG: hypothetical protein A3J29_00540 [Acidobacteria bacterium RIFCSPLOWO2_12_FULL_67_14b]|nr:MAG: hypothetical protein A3J29_00540 [Acidobacteria bacterium RIFCSPLOWO2_12_FULL_67_14b]